MWQKFQFQSDLQYATKLSFHPHTTKRERKENERKELKRKFEYLNSVELVKNNSIYSRQQIHRTKNSKKKWNVEFNLSWKLPGTKQTWIWISNKKKNKQDNEQTWIWKKTAKGLQNDLLREKRNKSKESNAGIVSPLSRSLSLSLRMFLSALFSPFYSSEKKNPKFQGAQSLCSSLNTQTSPYKMSLSNSHGRERPKTTERERGREKKRKIKIKFIYIIVKKMIFLKK